jgi:hypothetical protein
LVEQSEIAALPKTVSIRALKNWAQTELPSGSKTRALILSEPENLSPESFLAKWSSWGLLLREELA